MNERIRKTEIELPWSRMRWTNLYLGTKIYPRMPLRPDKEIGKGIAKDS